MGYTDKTWEVVNKVIADNDVKSMVDLGAQNDFSQPNLPAPYVRSIMESRGIDYIAIDLNGEDGCLVLDLSKQIHIGSFPLVMDAGTSEHVGNDGKPDIESFYNCWLNKFNLCEMLGIIVSENPKTGNWIGHGFSYVSKDFYEKLSKIAQLDIVVLEEHPACGNTTDGYNIICVMKKYGEGFPTFEEFKTLDVRTS